MLNSRKAYNYFNSRFSLVESTKGWYRFSNPFDLSHDDNSMAVNFLYMSVRDFRTGYSSTVQKFVEQYENLDYVEVHDLINTYTEVSFKLPEMKRGIRQVVKLPDSFTSFIFDRTLLGLRARTYLSGRGFDPEYLDSKGFGFCRTGDWMGYIIIPVKSEGRLVYFFGREFLGTEGMLRYKNPEGLSSKEYLYNEDALNLYDEINILEGWTDAETLGANSVATLSWQVSDEQIEKIRYSNCKKVNIIADKGFFSEALDTGKRLCEHKAVKCIPVDEFEGKDVNAIGKGPIMDKIAAAKTLTLEEVFKLIL